MFKLESNRLKREFKIANDTFFASQILNKYSALSFVPDGNGTEFTVHFTDDTEFSSKGLPVVSYGEENGRLSFTFAETMGTTVKVEYWVHEDKNTICKQLTITQQDDREIDFVLLENIGIVNSETHLGVDRCEGDTQIPYEWAALGQPFYIDSLFFGCEFPGADSRIVYGTGRIKFYLGKNVGVNYRCPITVMGAAKDNTAAEVKKAFGEYLDFISTDISLRFTYNSWFDNMGKTSAENISKVFAEVNEKLSAQGVPALDSYVVDDGWCDYKADFWTFNKKFPDGFSDLAEQCRTVGSSLGMWISPRGGYNKYIRKFGKKMEKAGNGFFNEEAEEICCASEKYIDKLADFMIEQTNQYNINCFKIDGFATQTCNEPEHDHLSGGRYDMYYVTDMWFKWVEAFKKYRASSEQASKAWINLVSYVNPSPFWLQWVNSIWIQNSEDIAFAENCDEQSKAEAEMTYRDARYFDAFVNRAYQLPLKAVYNHEPIYAKGAEVEYTDEEFEKYLYWCAVRGQSLNELYLSPEMLSDNKWASLAKVMQFQRENKDILKNAVFIGGNPEENNIYTFISWSEEGEGIIALRNPSEEDTPLTLTLNVLMGVPETLSGVRKTNIYCKSMAETDTLYSYNDKLTLTLHPFEIMIFKFTK